MSEQEVESYKEIIICPACKGEGRENIRVSSYDSEMVECPTCLGSGRLQRTTKVALSPYQSKKLSNPKKSNTAF